MKRTPLVRKTPLARKAVKPKAVHPERTAHIARMKRKAVSQTALEKRHIARLHDLPCVVTGKRPVEAHHLMQAPGKERRRDHRWAVPLHYLAHRGPEGIHGLGTEAKFESHHGLRRGFLIELAAKLWEETCAL
jgi:hypothetical protein